MAVRFGVNSFPADFDRSLLMPSVSKIDRLGRPLSSLLKGQVALILKAIEIAGSLPEGQ